MEYAAAIRQQADDLQEELRELELWQEEVNRNQEASKRRKTTTSQVDVVPPIRGTVPSLKEAVLKASGCVDRRDPVKEMKEKGNEFFQNGKLHEAVEAYSAGIDLDSEGPMAHILYGNRALCYLKLQSWVDAERDASSCVRLSRNYSKGYFRRAMARKQLGNLKGARTDLETVLALSPNDATATNEIHTVTKMIQVEQEATAPTTRKKIVIAEVEEDDEEESTITGAPSEAIEPPNTLSTLKERHQYVGAQVDELEKERADHYRRRQAEAHEEEARRDAKRRTSSRVEVVNDDKNDEKQGSASCNVSSVDANRSAGLGPQRSSVNTVEDSSPSSLKQNKPAEKHRDPQVNISRTLKTRTKWSKDTLTTPKSFTEFERVFSDINSDEDLCSHYISLVSPGSLRELFGNNMTPEILLALLRAIRRLSGTAATAFLKGLCAVKRVEDLALFFDSSEKMVAKEVLDVIVACGASQTDIDLFKKHLRLT
ncbi:putative TPR-repeat protein [Trypanosoma vivax]|nr:putative TPR-repeat protein [Trypanosoma vivax]